MKVSSAPVRTAKSLTFCEAFLLMHYVYILYSSKFDSFYIGYTTDLDRRLHEHNVGETKAKRPWQRVYVEEFSTQLMALRGERFLKAQRNNAFYKKQVVYS